MANKGAVKSKPGKATKPAKTAKPGKSAKPAKKAANGLVSVPQTGRGRPKLNTDPVATPV